MTTTELSRVQRVDMIGEIARTVTITADDAERAGLTRRFGLIAVQRLEAIVALARSGDTIEARGRLTAAVVQPCVASGEPVPATIDEPFVLRFVPEGAANGNETSGGEEIELGEADLDVIGYTGGEIDMGEAVAQTLGLALDPFPRAPGADEALRAAGVIDEGQAGPFAALKGLRDRFG